MRRTARFVAASFVAVAVLAAVPRVASAQEGETASAAMAQRGTRFDVGPALVLPLRDSGPYGVGLVVDGRYGIQAGPTVLAPGGRFAGYFISDRGVLTAMPTLRITVPVGPVAPYLVGGIGWGAMTSEYQSGLALLGGGGVMVHLGRIVAFGVEGTYQWINGTEFNTFTVMPVVSFGG